MMNVVEAANRYFKAIFGSNPRGNDGNILTNWVDDGKEEKPKKKPKGKKQIKQMKQKC